MDIGAEKQGSNGTGQQELTPREQEVLELAAQGLTYQETARALFISGETVRKHLKNCYKKLGVNNKIAAINAINKLR